MNPDTDAARPQLTLINCTESPATLGTFANTETPFTEHVPLLYVTIGAAMDLYATTHPPAANGIPAANYWGGEAIEDVLAPLPLNSRLGVNLEYWGGKDGWDLHQFTCAMARIKAMRPDLRLSLYAAQPYRHPLEYAETLQFTSFILDSVYPGVYANTDLAHVALLMEVTPDAIVMTGWAKSIGGGQRSVEPTEAEVRDIMRRLFLAGVTRLGIWMGPDKPGVHLRLPERIIPMAVWAQEEFARVHRPDADMAGTGVTT